MEKFKGKKLLVLGSNVGSVDIVKYARKNGAFVYVADYFPKKKSLAKLFADNAKAKEVLGWKPKYTDIKDIIRTAWDWEQNKKY